MDRTTVYAGQLPREVDILSLGKSAMVGLGALAQATLGSGPVADGFTLVPTNPASLTTALSGGSVYQQANIDATAWSSLPPDTRTIVKQGIQLDGQTITFAPPATTGYSQVFLVEAQYVDADDGATVLPYYNAANPAQGLTGPGGNGAAQPTVRRGAVAVQVKAGVAATAGAQTSPTPDAGWAPLFLVTVNAGQTQITAGNIAAYPTAPTIPTKLPAVPTDSQSGKWLYAQASGTNALTAALTPTPPALTDGLRINLALAATNTAATSLALNGFPAASIVRRDGQPLVSGDLLANTVMPLLRKGGVWRCLSPTVSEIIAAIPGSPNSAALLNPDKLTIEAVWPNGAGSPPVVTTSWQNYYLNSVITAEIAGYVLEETNGTASTNSIQLPPGTYDYESDANVLGAGSFTSRLLVVGGAEIRRGLGGDSYPGGADPIMTASRIKTSFTLATTSKLVLQVIKYSTGESPTSKMGDAGPSPVTNATVTITRRKGS